MLCPTLEQYLAHSRLFKKYVFSTGGGEWIHEWQEVFLCKNYNVYSQHSFTNLNYVPDGCGSLGSPEKQKRWEIDDDR